MKPLKYSAVMPKIALENLKLIETDEMVGLIGKDLETIRCALQESAYHDEVSTIPSDQLGTLALEEALLQKYARTLQAIIKASSGPIKNLLLSILKKIEVSNIKTMLRTVKSKMDFDEATKHIISVGTLDKERCKAIMMNSRSIEDVINSLIGLQYGETLKEVWIEHKANENLLPLEVALDKTVFYGILEAVENLKGLDKKIAESILGIEIDSVNVKIIFRGKAKGVSKEHIRDYLMPTAFLDEETLENIMEATDAETTIKRFLKAVEKATNPFYKDIFNQILNESESSLPLMERFLDSSLLRMSSKILKKYTRYYNIGFILSFLNLKWCEIKNLRCIIHGSERKVPVDKIKQFLIV